MTYDGERSDEKLRPLKLRRRDDGLYLDDETFPHKHDFSLDWLARNMGQGASFEITDPPEVDKPGKGVVVLMLENGSATYNVVVPARLNIELWEGTLSEEDYDRG